MVIKNSRNSNKKIKLCAFYKKRLENSTSAAYNEFIVEKGGAFMFKNMVAKFTVLGLIFSLCSPCCLVFAQQPDRQALVAALQAGTAKTLRISINDQEVQLEIPEGTTTLAQLRQFAFGVFYQIGLNSDRSSEEATHFANFAVSNLF